MARRPPQTLYAQSTGAKIAYQVSGAGRPDLVMVPGLVSHLDIQWHLTGYRRFVVALERGCRLIRFDKRGTAPLSPERIVEIFSADLATRGVETPASTSPLSDAAWLDLVHSTYVIPIDVAS